MVGSFGASPIAPNFMINALFILALESLKRIDELTDRKFIYEDLLQECRVNTPKAFFNDGEGAFALTKGGKEFTVLANSLAIILGLVSDGKAEKICEDIAFGKFVECSLSMRVFKYEALLSVNKEKWLPYVFNEIRRDYKMMLDNGATATWETIDGAKAFENAGSLCHGWTAIPIIY
jgi:hypothetical protein